MALVHTNTQVDTSIRPIIQMPAGMQQLVACQIFNNTGATIYLGDKSVSTSGATVGNALATAASVQLWLGSSDIVYAICATSPSGYLSILYAGV